MRVILTGGGTGGHLFPAIALAQKFKDCTTADILFVGSKKGQDRSIITRQGFTSKAMDLEGFKGKGILKKLSSLFKTIKGLFISISIIRGFRPDLVVGTGGYSSVPVVFMASIMGIKTVLLEQNVVPGLANRMLTPFVHTVFTAFKESISFFPEKKVMFSGNPIRREITAHKLIDSSKKGDRFNILIMGGSQGAHQINLAMIDALDHLLDIKDKINIIHQTGRKDLPVLEIAYNERRFSARVVRFIDDMGRAYSESDLVICRGGATTLSELMVCGKASIIIPFPDAADNHQEMNAEALEQKGAALVIRSGDLSGRYLADVIKGLYRDTKGLREMERAALIMSRPDATKLIVEECCRLVGESRLKIEYRETMVNSQL
ncbi:MAG: undecaprenyldiphospho-muramoylpentapeptide beta-N-acetylglucosaminyltransferase [Thermodesulfobacteriota bacterium]